MPKEQFLESQVDSEIAAVKFGINSAYDIESDSHIRVTSKSLYKERGIPFPNGVLDRRMGICVKDGACESCGKSLNECIGHFGYLDLALPVFHSGHFRNTIAILQMICKKCANVLLNTTEKNIYTQRLLNPKLSYTAKKSIHTQILTKCKKVRKCPNCQSVNGLVKKGPGLLKIVYDAYQGKKSNRTEALSTLNNFLSSSNKNRKTKTQIDHTAIIEELNPLSVLGIFKRIPQVDIPLLGMISKDADPENLIVQRIFVPPVCIRPSKGTEFEKGTREDDLTMKQSEIILINDVISKHVTSGGKIDTIQEDWDFLQLHVALFFNSEISNVPLNMVCKKSTIGIVQRLKGKQGRFRGNLSGKRVDFTCRSVISPDPNLMIHQVGVPERVAKILTYPERVNLHNIEKLRNLIRNGFNTHPGANYVQQKGSTFKKYLAFGNRNKIAQDLKCGDLVERHLDNGDIVLFNRQPSLHKLSIMCHEVKIHPQRTLSFNECVCAPYNADFDGDEMNLHFPQTEEAKTEAMVLMNNKYNLLTPRNGDMVISATQDFITGAYLLTQKNQFLTKEQAMQLAACLISGPDSNMHIDFPPPAIIKPQKCWTGKQIFSLLLRPNKFCPVMANLVAKGRNYTKDYDFCVNDSWVHIRNSELVCGIMDKATLGSGTKNSIFYELLRDFGELYAAKCMWRLSRMSSSFLMTRGFSFGISDVTPSRELLEQKRKLLMRGYRKCDEYILEMEKGTLQCQPGCNVEETLEAVILKELSGLREQTAKTCFNELHSTNSALIMAASGSKGSNINISQMIACVGQQAISGRRVPNGFTCRALPHFEKYSKIPASRGFIQNSFYSGLTPSEMFFHTMAGREGLVDTAVKTAETGYLQRRLVKCLEDLVVSYDNTVRSAIGEIVETTYGGDGLDPVYLELSKKPVDLQRQLSHIQAMYSNCTEENLKGSKLLTEADKIISKLDFCDSKYDFPKECRSFLEKVAQKLKNNHLKYKKLANKIERITKKQLFHFLECAQKNFNKCVVEPGTAVGALAAQSIGEPGTQMTLKTFHFAGVASMNITQGVPRIVEIINATKLISTPIIVADITDNTSMDFARQVKARMEKTTLGEVTSYIEEVYKHKKCFILIKIDLDRIRLLKLQINVATIAYSICASRISVKMNNVETVGSSLIIVRPDVSKHGSNLKAELERLSTVLLTVVVCGIKNISRAVVAIDDTVQPPKYKLCIEGFGLLDVISTYGVVGTSTRSNNIWEIYNTLGIEAARTTIINEIKEVMENHGMTVDHRHIMLLASQMTARGEVLGITRYGLATMRESVFNLASFEKTADHLFDAAYYGQTDKIEGVSERIILGLPAPVGTGHFKVLQIHKCKKIQKPQIPLLRYLKKRPLPIKMNEISIKTLKGTKVTVKYGTDGPKRIFIDNVEIFKKNNVSIENNTETDSKNSDGIKKKSKNKIEKKTKNKTKTKNETKTKSEVDNKSRKKTKIVN